MARRVKAGDRIIGYKAALTSKAMQQREGIDSPVLGTLLASRLREPRQRPPAPIRAAIADWYERGRGRLRRALVLAQPLLAFALAGRLHWLVPGAAVGAHVFWLVTLVLLLRVLRAAQVQGSAPRVRQ